MFGAGVPIAQVQPPAAGVFHTLIEAPINGPRLEIVGIVVANVDGTNPARFQICHDLDAGGTPAFDKSNALWWNNLLAVDTSFIWFAQHPGGGLPLGKVGALGFASDVDDALTCTVYAVSGRAGNRAVQGEE